MSNLVIILGGSGTGKSTSIRTLDYKETMVLNVLGKRLPFKGSNSCYNKENKNIAAVSGWDTIIKTIAYAGEKMPKIKNIVIDDACYIMRKEFFDRSSEKGYEKYNALADHFRKVISTSQFQRDDLNVFMLLHTESIEEDGNITGYKVATVGKLLDKMYNPLENVTITLFCNPKYDDNGNPTFGFYTHKMKVGSVELPCKTPEGMFEEDFIPNDLQLVVNKMNEYYK